MIDKYIKTDVEGLMKDPDSGAVVSVDNVRLDAYSKQKATAIKAVHANERLDKVENDLNDIKHMLQAIVKEIKTNDH